MRFLLAALLLASACAKKPAPKNPSNTASPAPSHDEEKETGAKDANAPDQADDDQRDPKSDPCDGGE
jgi:hypothetical protein